MYLRHTTIRTRTRSLGRFIAPVAFIWEKLEQRFMIGESGFEREILAESMSALGQSLHGVCEQTGPKIRFRPQADTRRIAQRFGKRKPGGLPGLN
jgi:hypothetical protein